MARAELNGRGTAPERALESIKPSPRAPRERSSSPKRPCERRHGPAEPTNAPALEPDPKKKSPKSPPPSLPRHRPDLGRSGIGPERALEAIKPSVAHSAKADPLQSFPASAGPVPRSTIKPQRSGIGPERALEAIKPSPPAPRESRSSPKLPCERRTGPP